MKIHKMKILQHEWERGQGERQDKRELREEKGGERERTNLFYTSYTFGGDGKAVVEFPIMNTRCHGILMT